MAHLAELFVRPDRLGRGIGGRLLTEVMAGNEERVTFASSDPRALPLYVRHGMRSVEPLLYLRGDRRVVGLLPVAGVSVEAADPDDVLGLDARASGWGGRRTSPSSRGRGPPRSCAAAAGRQWATASVTH